MNCINFINFINEIGYLGTKNKTHKYLENYYCLEFGDKSEENLKILEIGVRDGSSLKIWGNWFKNSDIIGIDIDDIQNTNEFSRININLNSNTKFIKGDAYSDNLINSFENDFFDYIIDDGPHTINSQKILIEKYFPKLKKNGKLIIEDIGCDEVPRNLFISPDQAIKIIDDFVINNLSSFEKKWIDLRSIGISYSIILELKKL